jgi:hypothetical protein
LVLGVGPPRGDVELDPLRIGVVVGGGVAVTDEHDAAVDHGDIGVGVPLQERGRLLHPVTDVPVEQDP